METSCCLQPLPPFYFKGSLLILRFICNELSGQDSACLCSYLHENLSLIILMKMEMHFFLLLSLDSGVKVTAGISERISAGYHLHDEWYLISDRLFWQEGSSSRQPGMWIWARQIWSFAKLGWGQQWVLCSVPASCTVAPAQALLAASLLMAWWSSNCLVAVTLWDCIFISSLAVGWGITSKILLQWWWHLSTLVVPSHRPYKPGGVIAFCFWPWTKTVFLPCYICVGPWANGKIGMGNIVCTVVFCAWGTGTVPVFMSLFRARCSLHGGSMMISRAAFRIMCTRSTALQGFYKHNRLGTLPFLFGLLSKDFWLPAGHRGSDCYKCSCNSRKAPELNTHAAVIALKSLVIFLRSLHAQLFSLVVSDMKWGKQVITDQPISNEPGGVPTEVPSPSACTDFRRTTQMLRSQPLRNTRKQLLPLP